MGEATAQDLRQVQHRTPMWHFGRPLLLHALLALPLALVVEELAVLRDELAVVLRISVQHCLTDSGTYVDLPAARNVYRLSRPATLPFPATYNENLQ